MHNATHSHRYAVRAAIASIALASTSAPLHAQGIKPDTAKPLRVTAGVAYMNASGNSNVTTLNLSERLEWKRPRFLWAQWANAVNGTKDGEQSASLLTTAVRGDWTPNGRLSVYALVSHDRNRFAKIAQRFEEGAGLSYRAIDRPRHRLTAELGSQFVQQRDLEGLDRGFLAGRAAQFYRFTFGKNAYAEERVDYLPSFEDRKDFRVNIETSLVAPLSKHLGVKLGYVVRFDNAPEPGVRKTDRFFSSGLQVAY